MYSANKKFWFLFKIFIIGKKGVGKSTFAKLIDHKFIDHDLTTGYYLSTYDYSFDLSKF